MNERYCLQYRTRTTLCLIIILFTYTFCISATFTKSQALHEHPSIVLSQQSIENTTIYLSDSLLIGSGDELIIRNSTIVIIRDQVSITVRTGGVLSISDTLLYSEEGCSWGISSEPGSELTVVGSTLIGAGLGTVPPYCGISIKCDDAVVSNCTISQFSADGIDIEDCNRIVILNNTISSTSYEGINIVRVSDSAIIGNQISVTGYCGIFATQSVNLNIMNNTISSTRYSGVCLDHTEQSVLRFNELTYNGNDCVSLGFCTGIIVEDNLMAVTNASGIGSIWSENLFLARNDISVVVYSGINLMIHTSDVIAVGNTVYNSSSDGMAASSCSNILFSGNYIDTINLNGFEIVSGSENITVMLNTVIDCGTGLNFVESEKIVVFGNWVNESYYHDIYTENSADGLVFMNAFCSLDIQLGQSSLSNFQWDNDTVGNYWEDCDELDENDDDIGDEMHVICEGAYDFYPLINYDLVIELRELHNILSGMWYENPITSSTTTDNDSYHPLNETEWLLILNSTIQLTGIIIILVVVRKRYY